MWCLYNTVHTILLNIPQKMKDCNNILEAEFLPIDTFCDTFQTQPPCLVQWPSQQIGQPLVLGGGKSINFCLYGIAWRKTYLGEMVVSLCKPKK